ncbi:MAG: hypothetical protein PGN08_01820 [Sphingomonas taxi]
MVSVGTPAGEPKEIVLGVDAEISEIGLAARLDALLERRRLKGRDIKILEVGADDRIQGDLEPEVAFECVSVDRQMAAPEGQREGAGAASG